jgi:hypothetical protein
MDVKGVVMVELRVSLLQLVLGGAGLRTTWRRKTRGRLGGQ